VSARVDLGEFVAGFIVEAEEHMRTLNTGLVQLDAASRKGASSPRAVRDAFRALHTMKGLAAMVGVDPIVDLAHAMEGVLRAAEKTGGTVVQGGLDALVEGSKAMSVRLRALADGAVVAPAPAKLLESLAASSADQSSRPSSVAALSLDPAVAARLSASEREQLAQAESEGKRAFAISFRPSRELSGAGVNITTVRARVSALGEVVKIAPMSEPGAIGPTALKFVILVVSAARKEALAEAASSALADVSEVAVSGPPRAPSEPAPLEAYEDGAAPVRASGFLRVEVARVEEAMSCLAALMVNRFRLGRAIDELASRGVDVRALREVAHDTRRQLLDMRGAVVGLRMVPMAVFLEPLPLLVRGLEAATKKTVQLERAIGDVEIDKTVAEQLWPAIVHLVRNAVDHGLESEERRTSVGKPRAGNITVRCSQRSTSQVEIVVEDDGGGVDVAAVAKRAGVEVPRDEVGLLDLLTRPGLSTRREADATSGRGMGLDIVRRVVVEELRGELRVATVRGAGTRFTLCVPVTLSVIGTFRFEAEGQPFLVPASMVEELVDVDADRLAKGPSPDGAEARVALLNRRDAMIPMLDLATLFGPPRAPRCAKAIVVKSSDALFAFGVDRLIDHQEVVVRPLADPLVSVQGFVGTTDLGEGRPTLVVDLVALTRAFGAEAARVA